VDKEARKYIKKKKSRKFNKKIKDKLLSLLCTNVAHSYFRQIVVIFAGALFWFFFGQAKKNNKKKPHCGIALKNIHERYNTCKWKWQPIASQEINIRRAGIRAFFFLFVSSAFHTGVRHTFFGLPAPIGLYGFFGS
jgi:hypothetical protein